MSYGAVPVAIIYCTCDKSW